MIEPTPLIIAFSIGILGSAHCIGMCGGIIGALTMAIKADNVQQRWLMVVFYNIGRLLSYMVIAWLFYSVIAQVSQYFALQFMRIVAGLLLIAMGLYLANWWRGLVYLEKLGRYLWQYIQPLSKSLLPVRSPLQALCLGVVWGWLPCGLIYSALAYSATATSSSQAVLLMLSFGLGTLPAVMASGFFAERLLSLFKLARVRQVFAVFIILFGVWTLWGSVAHSDHGSHHHNPDQLSHQNHHQHHSSDNSSSNSNKEGISYAEFRRQMEEMRMCVPNLPAATKKITGSLEELAKPVDTASEATIPVKQ